jgi:hypothetical protein
MAVITGKLNYFETQVIYLTTVLFEHVDDNQLITLTKDSPTSTLYAKQNVVSKGSFVITYPGSDLPPTTVKVGGVWSTGAVWPAVSSVDVDTLSVTALEDNSAYHSVVPPHGYKVEHDDVAVVSGQSVSLDSKFLYVPATKFLLNSKEHGSGSVITPKTNTMTILPEEDGKLIRLHTISIGKA